MKIVEFNQWTVNPFPSTCTFHIKNHTCYFNWQISNCIYTVIEYRTKRRKLRVCNTTPQFCRFHANLLHYYLWSYSKSVAVAVGYKSFRSQPTTFKMFVIGWGQNLCPFRAKLNFYLLHLVYGSNLWSDILLVIIPRKTKRNFHSNV